MKQAQAKHGEGAQPQPGASGDRQDDRSARTPGEKRIDGAREHRDSPWSGDPGPGAGKTSGDPLDYVPPGGADDAQGGEDDNRDVLRRPKGGTPNVPRP